MLAEKTYVHSLPVVITGRIQDYLQLAKVRLTSIVVFSAVMGYLLAGSAYFSWSGLVFLILGGFFITAGSNAINQILEKDLDKKMKRTKDRPLPAGRLGVKEAVTVSAVYGILGVFFLGYFLNASAALFGFVSLLLYGFAYTPLKKKSSAAVFVGAIPGALPPAIGWVAATGVFGPVAFMLFVIQFIWQFPHFWAIAWLLDDDYKKAGFRLLPSKLGKSKWSASQVLLYTVMLLPISFIPAKMEMTGMIATAVIFAAGLLFTWQAFGLYNKMTDKAATRLMLGSFIYLPVVQLALVLGNF